MAIPLDFRGKATHVHFTVLGGQRFMAQVRSQTSAAARGQDLRAGTTIICDRYAFSGVAYSVAKGCGTVGGGCAF